MLNALAIAGVGYIAGVDEARIQSRDCAGSTFYSLDDIGRLRCEAAQERMKRFSTICFQSLPNPIQDARHVEEAIQDCGLVIVCAEDTPSLLLRWANQACLTRGIPWTSGCLDGSVGMVGPSIIPHQTPCYECYWLRMKGNLEHHEEFIAFEKYLEQHGTRSDHFYGSLIPLPSVIGSLAALEAIKILTLFASPTLYGRLYEIDFLTLRAELHEILKLPRCPACGVTRRTPAVKPWSEQ